MNNVNLSYLFWLFWLHFRNIPPGRALSALPGGGLHLSEHIAQIRVNKVVNVILTKR